MESSLFDRLFANTIAFVLPGLAVLVGMATVNATVSSWFGAASASPSIVGFLFVVFAAVGISFALTAVRWFLYEKVRLGPCGPLVAKATPVNEHRRRQDAGVYDDLRFQHYFHYLASANLSVAVPVALIIWFFGSPSRPPLPMTLAIVVGGLCLMGVLALAACDAIARYDHRRANLLGAPASGSSAAA